MVAVSGSDVILLFWVFIKNMVFFNDLFGRRNWGVERAESEKQLFVWDQWAIEMIWDAI